MRIGYLPTILPRSSLLEQIMKEEFLMLTRLQGPHMRYSKEESESIARSLGLMRKIVENEKIRFSNHEIAKLLDFLTMRELIQMSAIEVEGTMSAATEF